MRLSPFVLTTALLTGCQSSPGNRTTEPVPASSQFSPSFLDRLRDQPPSDNPVLARLLDSSVSGGLMITQVGNDQQLRPHFVNAQARVEDLIAVMLREGRIKRSVGIIHTPTPPTPLCTEAAITPRLVAPEVSGDPARAQTVLDRAKVLRNYLQAGGEIFAAFPKNGRSQRSAAQLAIFDGLVASYPNLHQVFLNTDTMDGAMVGALYLFQTADNSWMAFAIKGTQAASPQDGYEWSLWLGSTANPAVAQRVRNVRDYLRPLTNEVLFPREVIP